MRSNTAKRECIKLEQEGRLLRDGCTRTAIKPWFAKGFSFFIDVFICRRIFKRVFANECE